MDSSFRCLARSTVRPFVFNVVSSQPFRNRIGQFRRGSTAVLVDAPHEVVIYDIPGAFRVFA